MRKVVPVFILWIALLAGCAVNPVTGKTEFMTVSTEQEIAMGRQNYVPMQQSQGGAYDTDPELTRYVQGVGASVAAHSPVALPYEFVVLNNSVPNAWALPGGKIAINRGLLIELESEAELAAVLGHEVVHAAARHTAQQMSRSMLLQGLVLATAVASSDSDYGNLAVGSAGVAAQLITMKYGRSAELESDRYGMQYMSAAGYDPQGAVSLQETFVRLSEDRQSDWLSGLFASHPPSQERVEANRATAAGLPPGGRSGTAEFQTAMQKTRAAKPAYDAYDDGRKALSEKRFDGRIAPSWTSSVASNCCRRRRRTTRWAASPASAVTGLARSPTTRSLPRRAGNTARPRKMRSSTWICRIIRARTCASAAARTRVPGSSSRFAMTRT
jgi:predicted Zn-dependent protease